MSETTIVPGPGASPARAPSPAGMQRPAVRRDDVPSDDLSVVEDGDASAWAVPYTDLTMLLLVFFVIMLSQAEPSGEGTPDRDERRAPFSSIFRAEAEAGEVALPLPAATDGGRGALPGGSSVVRRHDDRDDFAAEWALRVRELEATAAAFLERNELGGQVELAATASAIELRMSDDLLFRSGSAELGAPGTELIGRLAPLLLEIGGVVEVSGHTDDVPIRTARFPSNWELSAARAIAVVRHLRDLGVPERKMQAVGHGANRPIASNESPAGRAANRRVTIDIAPRPPGG